MRWRVLIALALIGGIAAGGLYCRGLAKARCRQLEELLRPLEARLEAGALPDSACLERAVALWEEGLPILSSLLHHQRLEAVGQGLSRGLGHLKGGDGSGCLAQVEAVLYLLGDIREYDDVAWKTLF